jgi:DNA invertase Pin-like site-specific DNA recombinase
MKRVVIYARVSSTEQLNGYSLDAQIDLCREWANEQGYKVVQVYTEPGKSAKTDNRPQFQRMISNVQTGQAGAVVIHKVDRFARNLLDLLQYKKLLKDVGVSVYSVSEEFLNGDSPENELVLRIIGATAEFVARNIGLEAKKGQDAMARAGRFPGSKLPAGYTRGDGSEIIECSEMGPKITLAFQEFATGQYTLLEWTRQAPQLGIVNPNTEKPFHKSAWHYIFRNLLYTGQFTWRDQTYEGDHPALVDPETWEAVQTVLDNNNTGGAERRHFWLLKDLLWSEVHERAMTGSSVRDQYRYYRAAPRQAGESEHAIHADHAERQAVKLLATLKWDGKTIPPTSDSWLLAIKTAPDLSHCFPHLTTDKDKRSFLQLVFLRHGLHVNAASVVTIAGLRPGFAEVAP